MVEQEVMVTADAPLLNSETPGIAGVIDQHAVANLLLDGKVTPRLTLSLGLRYIVQTVMEERDGSFSNFDFGSTWWGTSTGINR
jgi:hypothetical protein